MSVTTTDVAIVGAGFGGIVQAIELRRAGVEDIVILEAGAGIGGTWLWNDYPGCACDVPSHLYSYSFAQRREWSRLCSPQDEILDYAREVADEHGITPLVRTGARVSACTFDEQRGRWTVTTESGETFDCGAVVLATGQLDTPVIPEIAGLGDYEGEQFHSARWNHDLPLAGKDVAVIGTGASAVQFVPEIAGEARTVTVYQRTGNWMMPRKNRAYPGWARFLYRSVPGLAAARRAGLYLYTESLTQAIRNPRTLGRAVGALSAWYMRRQLTGDPELRAKVWPDYTFGCKRVLFSSHWIPTLRQPHVELVSDGIERFDGGGIVARDGTSRRADVVIWGTGFDTSLMPAIAISGRDGQTLTERWAGGPHAYLGIAVPGFPSLFMMYGPNTNTSGGSILVYLEAQAAYIQQAIVAARRAGGTIEVRAEVEQAADRALQERFAGTAWLDCDSWYRNEDGRIVTNWPDSMKRYVARTRTLDPSDFELRSSADDRELEVAR
ncbi:MAG: NAD(P)/FAD-dependent oxidoreductase [Baekduia sp.]